MKKTLYDIFAAITFFTKIPVWRLVQIPSESFANIIQYWPLTGLLTGGSMVLTYWLLVAHLPKLIAIIIALLVRTLITGALHEDGLADFFDGFGGGKSKEDILRIMKDSHTGSYALIGMIFYYLILVSSMLNIQSEKLIELVLFADVFSKSLVVLMLNFLPYARDVSDSKSKILYKKTSFFKIGFNFFLCLLYLYMSLKAINIMSIISIVLVLTVVYLLSKYKIGGYTGDVCGAAFLLCEVSVYVTYTIY
jgi:adenosylcobinamide-GDP ribazoletransferase